MIQTICAQAQGRRIEAAVAYAGHGALDLLPLSTGDLIVVNGSRNALANGATSAALLRDWFDRGVHVYVHETLHAKVFVVGRTAYVGSANLSRRAHEDHTVEAAMQTTDPGIVAEARAFVRRLADNSTPVSEEWFTWAETVRVTGRNAILWNPEPIFLPTVPFDIWVGPWEYVGFADEEEKLAEEGRRAHRVPGGRYDTVILGEDLDAVERLEEPDMAVLIGDGRSKVQVVKFLERRANKRAAMGFYRSDKQAVTLKPSELADVLGTTVQELRQGWFRADGARRQALLERFDLPSLPARSGTSSRGDRPGLRAARRAKA
ncbi:phospholipase D-like domain-containing protein [Micromonospora purpureochromogenes]|uniref:phospholipase D-like domain-containing protein n=1 Tax=Micromonospora purpureochromogenes TaxID=47872 RepID=UPI00156011AC|nr:phospholipase D-like domain-containing protein [Micromonospora purpureochromogenes]